MNTVQYPVEDDCTDKQQWIVALLFIEGGELKKNYTDSDVQMAWMYWF